MTLLVLDNDLGFLVWLAKALEPGGHCVVPADTVSQANRLILSLKITVDLLVIDPALEGAAAFSEELRRDQPRLKIIALVAPGAKKQELRGVAADATHAKPDADAIAALRAGDVTAEHEWGRFVREVAGARTAGSLAN
jgi:DNA-binding response OmpR family regulator